MLKEKQSTTTGMDTPIQINVIYSKSKNRSKNQSVVANYSPTSIPLGHSASTFVYIEEYWLIFALQKSEAEFEKYKITQKAIEKEQSLKEIEKFIKKIVKG